MLLSPDGDAAQHLYLLARLAARAQDTGFMDRWDAAEGVFLERFAAAEYWDVVEATKAYRRQANELRKEAMPICEAAGNW